MTDAKTRCIECGGFVGSLNEDEDGIPCSACAERLLETLPGVFHQPWSETAGSESTEVDSQVNSDEYQAEYSEHGYEDEGSPESGNSGSESRGRFGK